MQSQWRMCGGQAEVSSLSPMWDHQAEWQALSPAEPSHSPCFLSKTCATAQPYYTKDAGGGFAMPMHICMHIHMYRCTHVQVGGVAHARKVHVSMRVEVRRQPQVPLSEQLSVLGDRASFWPATLQLD